MPIICTEGQVEIPLPDNLTDKEYDDVLAAGEYLVSEFERACTDKLNLFLEERLWMLWMVNKPAH
jgi:hypothetical protein